MTEQPSHRHDQDRRGTQSQLNQQRRSVVLGVAASDAHAVANHLIAHSLRSLGFEVINLGTCTPVSEFAAACAEHPEVEAVVIGSLNGHAQEDLRDLPKAKESGAIPCPVVLGGNLSVGSHKEKATLERLYALGVDHILGDPAELPAVLDRLRDERRAADLRRVADLRRAAARSRAAS
ncbi:cobalamin-dependent protein [Streptomyces iconiensis]|uniref:Cobalamin-dependent protein n=1 Tax=Streptomyces iconiensis TaxID=1384038 RepID=A0ABT6ZUM0_9ACTN|nr:cobalamin-dependent protein [Streptomyces iconiensis]MDJ1132756.1 cobalamin-dependent protein [Streptomyces iconiensis]